MENWCINDCLISGLPSQQGLAENHNSVLNNLVQLSGCSIYRVLDKIEGLMIQTEEKIVKNEAYSANVSRVDARCAVKNKALRKILNDEFPDPIFRLEALQECVRASKKRIISDEKKSLSQAVSMLRANPDTDDGEGAPPKKRTRTKKEIPKFCFTPENSSNVAQTSRDFQSNIPSSTVPLRNITQKKKTQQEIVKGHRGKIGLLYMKQKVATKIVDKIEPTHTVTSTATEGEIILPVRAARVRKATTISSALPGRKPTFNPPRVKNSVTTSVAKSRIKAKVIQNHEKKTADLRSAKNLTTSDQHNTPVVKNKKIVQRKLDLINQSSSSRVVKKEVNNTINSIHSIDLTSDAQVAILKEKYDYYDSNLHNSCILPRNKLQPISHSTTLCDDIENVTQIPSPTCAIFTEDHYEDDNGVINFISKTIKQEKIDKNVAKQYY